eukprot:GHVP01063658.1.p1 GENE.GHVP01063658.1~~GHVP01063658.1.p1  ORF type:complete len:582 (+),score=132.40 GHVP01063658.1:202-1746(+)
MDGIYFISPTKESVDTIAKDFEKGKKYKAVHILFSGALQDDLMTILADSRAAGVIETLKEIYTEIIVPDSRGFEVCVGDENYLGKGNNFNISDEWVSHFSSRLSGIFISLEELPIIKYYGDRAGTSRKIAESVEKTLKEYQQKKILKISDQKTVLLILDRMFDLVSPLVHEFTYQAMVHDLLPLTKVNRYTLKSKQYVLDEDDEMWVGLRHMHIANCKDELDLRMKRFMVENKAAAKQAKGDTENKTGKSLEEMKDVIAALPEYNRMTEAFSLHMGLAVECTKKLPEKKLDEFGLLEQDMATGRTSDGKKEAVNKDALKKFLMSPSLTSKDKERLILLYGLTQKNANDADIKEMCIAGVISEEKVSGILNSINLRDKMMKVNEGLLEPKKESGGLFGWGDKEEEFEFELSRYETAVKRIFKQYSKNGLNEEIFQNLNGVQNKEEEAPSTSLRKKSDTSKPVKQEGKRLIVFITGGFSYSELRDAHIMSEKTGIEFIVGGARMETPESFLNHFYK